MKLSPESKVINVSNSSAIKFHGDIQNSTQQGLYSYHVAFLDKDRNLDTAARTSPGSTPARKARPARFMGLLPADREERCYSAVLYEGDRGIGIKSGGPRRGKRG